MDLVEPWKREQEARHPEEIIRRQAAEFKRGARVPLPLEPLRGCAAETETVYRGRVKEKTRGIAVLLLVLGLAMGTAVAKEPARIPAPSPEALPTLAASFHELLKGKRVRAPEGADVPLADGDSALLTRERLGTCLTTISEAGAWPSAWLVVQDESKAFDVVIRVRLGSDGRIESPDTVFAVARREWDESALDRAFREALGRKPPREREQSLVVQAFARRTVTRYVYNAPPTGKEARGLMAFLPTGSILREAKSVDLGDGRLHTLALVLAEAEFEPSDCRGDPGAVLGHSDSGKLVAVLAGESKAEDRLELAPLMVPGGARLLLPRYACAPGDEGAGAGELSPEERFRGREMVKLLEPRDLDGDGRALEVAFTCGIPREGGGAELRRVVLEVLPRDRKLRLVSASPLSP